uniref:Uncharacterized protein n=1 Tax=Rhizophora mucronata TaxID=61149 RepID=A0A2P2QHH5_RHIMU
MKGREWRQAKEVLIHVTFKEHWMLHQT